MSTTDPGDQYILDATKSVLDDLPTAMLAEVIAHGAKVLADRAESANLTLTGVMMAAAMLDEPEPIAPPEDDDEQARLERIEASVSRIERASWR